MALKEDSRLPGSGGRFQAALLARPGRAPVLWPSTRFFWLIAALFLAAGCFSPTPATNRDNGSKTGEAGSSSPEIREKWDLWTSGTLLRGANVYQRLTYPRLDRGFNGPGPLGPPYTQRDFDKLASLGANVVTVSHPGFLADAPPYRFLPEVEANLDRLIEMARTADLFVIIAVRTGPGRNEFAIHPQEAGKWYPVSMRNNTLWTSGKAQVAWARMWRRLSEKYRDEPLVVGYEIMVEPNANDLPLEVYDPDNFYRRFRHSQYDWNRLYPKIIKSIRQVDEATPVLLGPMGYSSVRWLSSLGAPGDMKTAYTVHQYEPHAYTHQVPAATGHLEHKYPGVFDTDWDGREERFDSAWLKRLIEPVDRFKLKHNRPVAVTEFGIMRWQPGAELFLRDQMSLFERRGMNYSVWLWESMWPALAESDAFNFRHGPDHTQHTEVGGSAFMSVLKEYWAKNTVRPSTVAFGDRVQEEPEDRSRPSP